MTSTTHWNRLFLLSLATFAVRGQIFTPELTSSIQQIVAAGNLTGLSVGVVRDGKVESASWGLMDEEGNAATPETIFPIGSCSKAFLSFAMGVLIDDFSQGKNTTALPANVKSLTWTTKVQDLLPGKWELEDSWTTQRANIKDLLSHVTGLPRHDFAYSPTDTVSSVLPRIKFLKPDYELREQYSYNNIMYGVASHIITLYSGQKYEDFVEKRIFIPLNMSSSTFSSYKANATGEFTQSFTADGRRIPAFLGGEFLAGAGGVFSSAVDMEKWMTMLMNNGVEPSSNTTYISLSSLDTVTSAQSFISGTSAAPLIGYAMGWIRNTFNGHEMVYHDGSVNGATSLLALIPEQKVGAVILTNGDSKANENSMVLELVFKHLGLITEESASPSAVSGNATTTTPSIKKRAGHVTRALPSTDKLAGTYSNPGYGNITLCHPSSQSNDCTKVVSDFFTVDPSSSNTTSLFGAWSRTWATHVKMDFAEDNYYRFSLTSLFPQGYGKDTSPFERASGTIISEFDVRGDDEVVGFGVAGVSTEWKSRSGEPTVEGRSDIWFKRVQ